MMTDKIIKISNLVVNMENYRFEPQSSQHDAIIKMVTELGDKIFNLAADIVENGLSPIDSLIVIPHNDSDKQFVVLEGNRRVCALKLTSNPSLLPDEFSTLRKHFIKLNKDNADHLVKEARCVVCETIEEADLWIKRKHYGEQDGVGTVTWNAQQKQRFAERVEGVVADSMQVIALLNRSELVHSDIKYQLKDLKITSLERLLADAYVRERLGVYKVEGKLVSKADEGEVIKGLLRIVSDLLDPTFKVANIYNKEDRKNYIDSWDKTQSPDLTRQSEKEWSFMGSDENTGEEKNPPRPARKPRAKKTKPVVRTLVTGLELPIDNPKISSLFVELQRMPVDDYPLSVAVMLRVFLELSVDEFIDTFGIQYNNALTACDSPESLENKVKRVTNYMQINHMMSKDQYKGIHMEMKDSNSILSVDTLNAFVHNKSVSPKADNLIIGWNNIQVFFEMLWKVIDENKK